MEVKITLDLDVLSMEIVMVVTVSSILELSYYPITITSAVITTKISIKIVVYSLDSTKR